VDLPSTPSRIRVADLVAVIGGIGFNGMRVSYLGHLGHLDQKALNGQQASVFPGGLGGSSISMGR